MCDMFVRARAMSLHVQCTGTRKTACCRFSIPWIASIANTKLKTENNKDKHSKWVKTNQVCYECENKAINICKQLCKFQMKMPIKTHAARENQLNELITATDMCSTCYDAPKRSSRLRCYDWKWSTINRKSAHFN